MLSLTKQDLRVTEEPLDKGDTMLDKLKSRKLWVALGAIASAVVGAVGGSVSWEQALPSIAAIAIGYCVSQGWVDAKALDKAIKEEPSSE